MPKLTTTHINKSYQVKHYGDGLFCFTPKTGKSVWYGEYIDNQFNFRQFKIANCDEMTLAQAQAKMLELKKQIDILPAYKMTFEDWYSNYK